MKRSHPYLVQNSLEAAQGMAKAGVEFVPMPILSADDHCELADQMVMRLERLAQVNAGNVHDSPEQEATSRKQIEAADYDAVVAELESLRPDAERFRFVLRSEIPEKDTDYSGIYFCKQDGIFGENLTPEEAIAAIDAAMVEAAPRTD